MPAGGFIPQTSGNVAAFYNQPTQPSGVNIGDLWFDNVNIQFKQWDGTNWQLLYFPTGATQKNAIINGNMDVWQRGTGTTTVIDTTILADRWKNFLSLSGGGITSVAQSTDVPTLAQSGTLSNYSLSIQVTTAQTTINSADYYILAQGIEGYNWRLLTQRWFTISFWVKAFKPGIYYITLRNASHTFSLNTDFTINKSGEWEKKMINIPPSPSTGAWDYTNGVGIWMYFLLACGSSFHTSVKNRWVAGSLAGASDISNGLDSTSNYFRFSQVQVEPGIVATPFEERLFADELLRCQRYTWATGWDSTVGANWVLGSGRQNTSSLSNIVIHLPTTMRTTPVLIATGSDFGCDDGVAGGVMNAISMNSANTGIDKVWINCGHASFVGTPGNGSIMYTQNAGVRLILHAEF